MAANIYNGRYIRASMVSQKEARNKKSKSEQGGKNEQ
jgi:hypothetical protein